MILAALGLAAYFLLPAWAAPPASNYDSLRLYTEALFEVSHKYVWPKEEEDLIYGSLRGMMNSLDPDSSFLTAKEYQDYLLGPPRPSAEAGVDLIVKDGLLTAASVIDGGAAARAGLKPGDHIIKINGQMVRNLTTQEATRRSQGAPNTAVKLQVIRNGEVKPLDLTITLEPLGLSTVTTGYLDNAVAYIRIRYFNNETPGELDSALNNIKQHKPPVKGIILDLRNNARGSMEEAVRSASLFLGNQQILTAKGRSTKTEQSFTGKDRDLIFKTLPPMVVLVDQGTARAAEIIAAALRDQGRATLLGVKTLGLCGLTKAFPLEDGSALMMTVAQCYSPKGDKIPGKGLEPEVPGQKPQAGTEPEKAPAQVKSPEQDPWVQQAKDVLTSGKPKPAPQTGPAS
ncbi:MAG: PDZ domain-containing protein [Deltaproteobacteria bacterium]|nr:PDZ domain-containing protein [Deltaproteobacteria bacterium]